MVIQYLRGLMTRQTVALTADRVLERGDVPQIGILASFSDERIRAAKLVESIERAVADTQFFPELDRAVLEHFFLRDGKQDRRLADAAEAAGVRKTVPKNSLNHVLGKLEVYLSSDTLRAGLGGANTSSLEGPTLLKVIQGPPGVAPTGRDRELATLSIAVPEATSKLGLLYNTLDPSWVEGVVQAECPRGVSVVLPVWPLPFQYAAAYDAVIDEADSVVFCADGSEGRAAGWSRYVEARAAVAAKPFEEVVISMSGASR